MGPLAVSSLALPAYALDEGLALIAGLGCRGLELAPFRLFGGWDGIAGAAQRLRERMEAHGLECVALQGILDGADDVSLFGSAGQQGRLEQHLDHVAALAGILGARSCVFLAPQHRNPGDLGADEAWHRALGGLRRIAPAFDAVGSAIAFGAVAARDGGRFVTTTAEAVRLVSEAAVPGVGLLLDTGTLLAERVDPAVLVDAAPLAVHLHVTEPDLGVVGSGGNDHSTVAAGLVGAGYDGPASLVMLTGVAWREEIGRAVAFVKDAYL